MENRVMKTNKSRKAGFTLVEIMIVVAIIGLLAAIAIPNFVRSRSTAQMNTCINNLRQIDGAKQEWALEKGKQGSDTPSSTDVALYIGRAGTAAAVSSTVFCPVDPSTSFPTSYGTAAALGTCATAPVCLIKGTATDYPHALKN
jgi:prepilin-type N-terminal cleavage/methylation domain-containing protein